MAVGSWTSRRAGGHPAAAAWGVALAVLWAAAAGATTWTVNGTTDAVDAIPFSTGMTTDQRGEARPADGDMDGEVRQDIGAHELVVHPGDADGSGWYDAVDLAVEIALAWDSEYPADGDADCTANGFFEPFLDIPCTVAAIW